MQCECVSVKSKLSVILGALCLSESVNMSTEEQAVEEPVVVPDMKKAKALVKWITNDEDNGTYTVNVPVTWIKDFVYTDWLETRHDADLSEVVEWREGTKPPMGYPCYDAKVIMISGKC